MPVIYSSTFAFHFSTWCKVTYKLGTPHFPCSHGDSPSDNSHPLATCTKPTNQQYRAHTLDKHSYTSP